VVLSHLAADHHRPLPATGGEQAGDGIVGSSDGGSSGCGRGADGLRVCRGVDPDVEAGIRGTGAAPGFGAGIAGGGGRGVGGDAEQFARAASSGAAAVAGEGGGGVPDVRDAWVSGLHLWGKVRRDQAYGVK